MRRVDRVEEGCERSLLNLIQGFDAVNGRTQLTQASRFFGLHNWVRGVEPSTCHQWKGGKRGRPCGAGMLMRVTDSPYGGRLGRVETLESSEGERFRSVGERLQHILDRIVLIFAALSCQVKAMSQEGEDALRTSGSRRHLCLLVGTVHGGSGSFPPLPGVGEGERSLHDDVEQLAALPGNLVSKRQRIHSVVPRAFPIFSIVEGRSLNVCELIIDPADLRGVFVAAEIIAQFRTRESTRAQPTSRRRPTSRQRAT